MNSGMLWFDDTKRPLDARVAGAVEYYKSKYGASPTVCFVHPSMLAAGAEAPAAAGVQLRAARTILVNHFWLGVDDNTTGPQTPRGTPRGGKRAARRKP
jgi:hypothetical protein